MHKPSKKKFVPGYWKKWLSVWNVKQAQAFPKQTENKTFRNEKKTYLVLNALLAAEEMSQLSLLLEEREQVAFGFDPSASATAATDEDLLEPREEASADWSDLLKKYGTPVTNAKKKSSKEVKNHPRSKLSMVKIYSSK